MKLTKTELRDQQVKLQQLQKYLPTLQLKKVMLQQEVNEAASDLLYLTTERTEADIAVQRFTLLFSDARAYTLFAAVKIDKIVRHTENIAGVEVPLLEEVQFSKAHYSLYDSPSWLDSGALKLKQLLGLEVKIEVARERKYLLEKELREVSIRLNLFEKILIPRCLTNIKKIKVFLGDQQLAAVSQAKVAKKKIEERAAL